MEYTNAIGEKFATYSGYIQSLMAIYKPGTYVVPVTGKHWAVTQKKTDRRANYVPGARESQVEYSYLDGDLIVRRTQTIHDHIVPYVTERHRLKGCAPVSRTTVKVQTWVIPNRVARALRKASRRKRVDLPVEAIKLLAKEPNVALTYDTWSHLLAKACGPIKDLPSRSSFTKALKRCHAFKAKAVLGSGAWTLPSLPWPDGRHVPRAHNLKVPMVLAGGLKPHKNHIRLAKGLRPKGRVEAWTITTPMTGRDGFAQADPGPTSILTDGWFLYQ